MTMPQARPAPAPTPALANPATGSANPAASLTSLWNYVAPAAAHLMQSPSNTPGKAPALDVSYHMGIHTAVYNYFTVPRAGGAPAGADFYELLDGWFGDVAREALLGVPQDDSERLVQYLLPCFARYEAGAGAVSRLLNYTNRQYVKRAVDEDRGWLRLADVIDDVAEAVRNKESHAKLAGRLRARRDGELVRWGWSGAPSDSAGIARAEAAAEAAAPPDRVVPLAALAQRRFRMEVLEPLLLVPKAKKKGKGKAKGKAARTGDGGGSGGGPGGSAAAGGSGSGGGGGAGGAGEKAGPKGRLARAVKELLEGACVEPAERARLARELARMLRATGVPPEHALCRKLAKFNAGAEGAADGLAAPN